MIRMKDRKKKYICLSIHPELQNKTPYGRSVPGPKIAHGAPRHTFDPSRRRRRVAENPRGRHGRDPITISQSNLETKRLKKTKLTVRYVRKVPSVSHVEMIAFIFSAFS